MRRQARVDANHLDICQALRKIGATVISLAPLGRGVPDLCFSYRGRTYLAEIKDGKKKWKLTDDQKEFLLKWEDHILLFTSVEDVILWANRGD